jgi:hypothetical protein
MKSKNVNETRSPEPTPDQLLQMLDLQLQSKRARRQQSQGSRTTFRLFSIILIVGGSGAALLFLQFILSDLPEKEPLSALSELVVE